MVAISPAGPWPGCGVETCTPAGLINVLQPDPVSPTQAELSSKYYLSKELVRRLELGSACSLITPQAPG